MAVAATNREGLGDQPLAVELDALGLGAVGVDGDRDRRVDRRRGQLRIRPLDEVGGAVQRDAAIRQRRLETDFVVGGRVGQVLALVARGNIAGVRPELLAGRKRAGALHVRRERVEGRTFRHAVLVTDAVAFGDREVAEDIIRELIGRVELEQRALVRLTRLLGAIRAAGREVRLEA